LEKFLENVKELAEENADLDAEIEEHSDVLKKWFEPNGKKESNDAQLLREIEQRAKEAT
jgi:hypothetical protein